MTTYSECFMAVLYNVGQLRCVDVPERFSDALGGGRHIPVLANINGLINPTALVSRKGGGHRMYVPAHFCESLEVDTGDPIRVSLAPDPRYGEPELPADLVAALGKAGAMEALLERSPSDRRQLVRWIAAPKSEEARQHRIEQAVQRVLKGPPKRKKQA